MPPVARLGDKCVAPSGKSGVITTASDFYFVEDKPAARVGDTVTYSDGSTTVIAEGDPGLEVVGRGVARLGYRLADGGKIVEGARKVFSDDPYPGAGSVAERVMVAARANGQAFVPADCPLRHATAPDDDAPPRPDHQPEVEIHSDLADGGAPSLFADVGNTTRSARAA